MKPGTVKALGRLMAYTDRTNGAVEAVLNLYGCLKECCASGTMVSDDSRKRFKNPEFRTAKNGKRFAINAETGETSGLGPGIDGETSSYEPFPNKRQMNEREVEGFLKKQGFELQKKSGGDPKWKDPQTGEHVTYPKHQGRNIAPGTLGSIRRQYKKSMEKRKQKEGRR